MRSRIALSSIGLLICILSAAQDYQYTQFYAAPVNLNPAFTGNTTQSRIVMNYRNQWTAIPGAFVTYNLSYEHFIPKIKSGVGILMNHDRAGSGNLGYTSIAGLYSYEFQVNYNLFIRPGISFGKSFRTLDYDRLVFGDQLVVVFVGRDHPSLKAFSGSFMGKRADDVVGFITGCLDDRNIESFHQAVDQRQLSGDVFRHRISLGFVFGILDMPLRRLRYIKGNR